MGLDITAFSQLKHIGKHGEGRCDLDDHIRAFAYDVFRQSFRGIPVLSTRTTTDGSTFIEGGCYTITDGTVEHDFQAGSYGGYGMWRANLRDQFNPATDPDGPFYELIWFADNEGSIGCEAARDLLVDFWEHADRYMEHEDWPAGYGRERYENWTRACELAADGGLIRFH